MNHDLSALSIHVGSTPIVELRSPDTGKPLNITAKLEHTNPTGSHKDRSLLVVQDCLLRGVESVGCASSGNFGFSLSYFAKQAGLNAHIWISSRTSASRKKLLQMHHPTIHELDAELAQLVLISDQIMEASYIYNANPGFCHLKSLANRAIATEIISFSSSIKSVYACVNNGTHLLGLASANTPLQINGVYSYDDVAASICGFSQAEGFDNINKAISLSSGNLLEATVSIL